ncbi:MAG: RNA-binding protein [Chloroflexi bacterium]|nr:RNA-binding protein [Chloroflexota bacterium]
MDIYVGNLPWSVDDKELDELFSEYGDVESAKVIKYKDSNRSKGFGFVEMDDESAAKAIKALEGHELEGRPLKVNQSRGKSE